MTLRTHVPLVALLTLLTGCASSFDVYDANAARAKIKSLDRQVLFYALPRTVVGVEVAVEKKTVDPPKCVDAASTKLVQDLGLTVATPGVKLQSATITTRSQPDPARVYAVDLSRRWYQKFTSTFGLTEAGVLSAANIATENQAIDFAVTTVKTAVGLGLKAAAGGASLATTCQDKRAEIIEIEKIKREIIRDEFFDDDRPRPDGATIALMLERLTQREKDLLVDFVGATTVKNGTVRCDVIPAEDDRDTVKDLFHISTDGVSAASGFSCRIPAELMGSTGTPTAVKLRFKTDRASQFAGVVDLAVTPRADPSGLVYRVPAATSVEVLQGDTPRSVDQIAVAQFGVLTALPRTSDVSTFQSTVNATLYPSTGALQKLDFNATPRGTGAVTGLADAAGAIFDAEAAKKKAEAAANDELAQLERTRKILEEEKKIRDLLAALPKPVEEP